MFYQKSHKIVNKQSSYLHIIIEFTFKILLHWVVFAKKIPNPNKMLWGTPSFEENSAE